MLLAGRMNDHIGKVGTVSFITSLGIPESIMHVLHYLVFVVTVLFFLFDTFK